MNKKGQALVEFIIILPIFIYLVMGLIDFIMISKTSSNLDDTMKEVINLYHDDKENEVINYLNKVDKEINISTNKDGEYLKIVLSKDYTFITPFLSNIIDDKYIIKSERLITNN